MVTEASYFFTFSVILHTVIISLIVITK